MDKCSTAEVGVVMRLQDDQFVGKEWETINQPQAMKTLAKILRIKDAGYRVFIIRTKPGLSEGDRSSLLEVWAGWFPEPAVGSILVCVYAAQESNTH